MPLPPRCAWTGARSDRAAPVEVAATDRFGRPVGAERLPVLVRHPRDTVALAGVAVLGSAGVLSESLTLGLIGGLMALLGGGMWGYPFTTPATVKLFGVRRSITFARWTGALTLGLGLATIAFSAMGGSG